MDKALKYSIYIGAILICYSVFYYFTVYIPKYNKPMMEQGLETHGTIKSQDITDADRLRECYDEAYRAAKMNWNYQCRDLNREDNCELPDYYVARVDRYLKKYEDHCELNYGNQD